MEQRDRLIEIIGEMQRDLLPSLIRAHSEDDLRLVHAVLLRVIAHQPVSTVGEIAEALGRSRSRTSRLIDQLVNRGLVARGEDGADRRIRRVRLTEEGRALLRRIDGMRVDAQLRLWEHLDDDERATVFRAMELLAAAAKRMKQEAEE
ncbi:MarR family winged helix-turn-helix transcriptional regulator [Nocardiopsis composta]|uniref:DNA-binding MarR family transcriptional regulator n=1 Tax=Nocardiopsis composta TaxID=157465 RepID=A0A7W8QTH0_9ACTN|nr:MarR family transcriptional regulator [Nocardiopsis composta]MBB5436141.1 DNA-binding MarR family transcriptional regulator [Nocardiopsis composta]